MNRKQQFNPNITYLFQDTINDYDYQDWDDSPMPPNGTRYVFRKITCRKFDQNTSKEKKYHYIIDLLNNVIHIYQCPLMINCIYSKVYLIKMAF